MFSPKDPITKIHISSLELTVTVLLCYLHKWSTTSPKSISYFFSLVHVVEIQYKINCNTTLIGLKKYWHSPLRSFVPHVLCYNRLSSCACLHLYIIVFFSLCLLPIQYECHGHMAHCLQESSISVRFALLESSSLEVADYFSSTRQHDNMVFL